MAKDNAVHLKVGEILNQELKKYDDCTGRADRACGGSGRVPLFCDKARSRASGYCDVDFLIAKNGQVKLIVEIEESDIKPTQICGKIMTSALSRFYLRGRGKTDVLRMADSVTFLQVLDVSKLRDKTSKLRQFRNLEKSIQEVLPMKDSKITTYKLLTTTQLGEIPGIVEEALRA